MDFDANSEDQTEEAYSLGSLGGWMLDGFVRGGTVKPVPEIKGPTDITKDVKIIDCDSHLTETPDLWTSRMPITMRDKAPFVRHRDGLDYWVVGGVEVGPSGASVIAPDRSKLLGRFSFGTLEECHAAAWDVKPRLAMMDELGIHAQICYPNSFAAGSINLPTWVDKDTAEAIVQVYNDDRADRQAASGDRLLPMAVLPLWDRDVMMKEAIRCVEELGAKGFAIPDRPEQFGLPGFLQDYWTPFFELCNDKKIPLNFHIASGAIDGFQMTWEGLPLQKRFVVGMTLFFIGNSVTLSNFILSGLFDKYPNLKVVSVESGIGWVPFILEALEWQIRELMPDKGLQRRPIEYFRDHFFGTFWFEKDTMHKALEILGPNNILFETDFPHPTSLYPEMQDHLVDTMGSLDPKVRKLILQDNAARVYNLDL